MDSNALKQETSTGHLPHGVATLSLSHFRTISKYSNYLIGDSRRCAHLKRFVFPVSRSPKSGHVGGRRWPDILHDNRLFDEQFDLAGRVVPALVHT